MPDLPHARAALLNLRPGSLSRGRMYRACLEGVALNLAAGVARMRGLGIACSELRAVGGGAKNRVWLQILADACGASVLPLVEAESGALGAALQALWSVSKERGLSVDCDQVAQPWVEGSSAVLAPDEAGARALAQLGKRFQVAQEQLFRVG